MTHIRTLDISELNDRLEELIGFRDNVSEAKATLAEAQKTLVDYEASHGELAPDDSGYEELSEEVANAREALERAESDFDTDAQEELTKLEALRDEIGSKGDLICDNNGPFIHEEDFTEYCQDMCEDIGDVPKDFPSYVVIDWDRTADNIRADYTEIEWDGGNYLYRE
jgi:chromosome segregation ATPase